MLRHLVVALLLAAAVPASAARYVSDHAGDPVKWNAWSREALERARKSDRPLFVSVGSAASWECERMHRDTFSGAEVARLLNTYFVPVLLDRTDFPREAAAFAKLGKAMSVADGCTVNLLVTPDLQPFAATGEIDAEGLSRMLVVASNQWANERESVQAEARTNLQNARSAGETRAPGEVGVAQMEAVVDSIATTLDTTHGGFGATPRTPHAMTISFLLRYATRTKNEAIRALAVDTLRQLATTPIRDQIGGGFHRATRDDDWRDPYFEKTLADQALMSLVYLDAWQLTGDRDLEHVVRTTLDYVVRDLQLDRGLFQSSQYAYSLVPLNGRPQFLNGAFYLWDRSEVTRLIGGDGAGKVFRLFAMKMDTGNLPRIPEQRLFHEVYDEQAAPLQTLLTQRQKRPEPFRDVPTAGENGLVISALSRASSLLGEDRWLEAATLAAAAVDKQLWSDSKKSLQRTADGANATALDYALLVRGMLDLFEAAQDVRWLKFAIALQQRQDALFWDASTARYVDDLTLPAPLRGLALDRDDDLPSPNSVATVNLLRLGTLTQNATWSERPAMTFVTFGGRLRTDGASLAHLAEAFELSLLPRAVLVVTGDPRMQETNDLLVSTRRSKGPMETVVFLPHKGPARQRVLDLVPFIATAEPGEEHPRVWRCASDGCTAR